MASYMALYPAILSVPMGGWVARLELCNLNSFFSFF